MGGRWAAGAFPQGAPLAPVLCQNPLSLGAGSLSIPVPGDKAGWLQLWASVCTVGQPRTPEPPQFLLGWQSCLCPHPPLLSSLHSPVQKLVFNRVNGKRPPLLLQQISAPEECYTLAHEENVRFVYEAWQQVEQQLDGSRSGESTCGPVQYVEKTPNPGLKNFVPIDLEEWWAQQFLAKIENGS
uniref:MAPK regulated corepressor interacting protein 2 n=1 Tax=Taeniopygia guttata TaxID=59729 RepID=H0YYX0_TAEGU